MKVVACLIISLIFSLSGAVAQTPDLLYGGLSGNSPSGGSVGIVDQTDASFTLLGDPTTQGPLSGLAFNSAGALFGNENVPGQGGRVGQLIQIDPADGSLLATIGPIQVSGTPLKITGLTFQPGTDSLFGMGSNADLYTINTSTATATLVGSNGLKSGRGGLAFRSDGRLFLATVNAELAELDPSDGSVIGSPISLAECFDGLSFRSSDDVLFGTECDSRNIFTIDVSDASLTPVGDDAKTASLAFTPGGQEPTEAIPTLSEWGMILLTMLLAGFGIRGASGRSKTPLAP